jgi:hypothetical protein
VVIGGEVPVLASAPGGDRPAAAENTYIGYTMDYWNVSQGNNWGPTSSVLAFDTEDPVLIGMARALAGGAGDDFVVGSGRATFRIGGSTADMTDYAIGGKACTRDPQRNCLTMPRWLTLLGWAGKVNAQVVFTLNGMAGRGPQTRGVASTAPWDPANAAALLAYTKQHAPPGALAAVGLGNELTNGNCAAFPNCPAQVAAGTYARDVLRLRALLDRLWADDPVHRPLVAVPDAGYATNLNMSLQLEYFDQFLKIAGAAVDRVSYHMYVDGDNNPQVRPAFSPNPEYPPAQQPCILTVLFCSVLF